MLIVTKKLSVLLDLQSRYRINAVGKRNPTPLNDRVYVWLINNLCSSATNWNLDYWTIHSLIHVFCSGKGCRLIVGSESFSRKRESSKTVVVLRQKAGTQLDNSIQPRGKWRSCSINAVYREADHSKKPGRAVFQVSTGTYMPVSLNSYYLSAVGGSTASDYCHESVVSILEDALL
ncbi:uncharacterized protein BT62DRAFT_994864 [Guyanagaster necrorhizus]|uniref:Uncharacterized protein n=1 Tax=Guyanagaster necrorhizus TaxID=856835 RepID=A0A9P8ARN7_9AGAR|nr:uncharacterized protein BT62DRAFT_994864 [Guyanagaster necrorhizus MCA 3950]KAG7445384.1 hypothetical protein BT62DRAFT_994864 [Guyanagaster necrorhizus MCA 3950]